MAKEFKVKVYAKEVISDYGGIVRQEFTNLAANDTNSVHVSVAGTLALQTVSTGFGTMDFPRNILIVPNSTTADVNASTISIRGTDIRDVVITENFGITENQATISTGSQAFKTVTRIVIPAQDGTGCKFSFGRADKMGLNRLYEEKCIFPYKDGVADASATISISSTTISRNTVQFATNPNGAYDYSVVGISTEYNKNVV